MGVTFDITPIGYKRMTRFSKYNPEMRAYYDYKDALRYLALAQKFTLPDQFQALFVLPMPASWPEKEKQRLDGAPHQQKPDADNLLKALSDALKTEDKTIWDVSVRKLWGRKGSITIETYE